MVFRGAKTLFPNLLVWNKLRLTLHSRNAGDPASLKLRKARQNIISAFVILFNFNTATEDRNSNPGTSA
jgi:hypothetical protein